MKAPGRKKIVPNDLEKAIKININELSTYPFKNAKTKLHENLVGYSRHETIVSVSMEFNYSKCMRERNIFLVCVYMTH